MPLSSQLKYTGWIRLVSSSSLCAHTCQDGVTAPRQKASKVKLQFCCTEHMPGCPCNYVAMLYNSCNAVCLCAGASLWSVQSKAETDKRGLLEHCGQWERVTWGGQCWEKFQGLKLELHLKPYKQHRRNVLVLMRVIKQQSTASLSVKTDFIIECL